MNARTNPFASRHMESLPFQHPDRSLEEIIARLKRLNCRAAIIGQEGSGKTTLLETIGKRLRQDGYKTVFIRFNQENRRLKKTLFNHFPKNRIPDHAYLPDFTFLVDGVEQLSWLDRKLFCLYTKKAGAVIITSHVETRMLKRMPTL